MIRKTGNVFTTAYLLLIFGVYPFYMKQGYVDIGKAKYQFFIYSSLAALVIFALIGAVLALQKIYYKLRNHTPGLIDWDKVSAADLFVMMYATEIILSYILSDYREEAWRGTEGWYMGLALQLTLCALYFFISRLWDGRNLVWYIGIAASGMVFLLGILDRFSIYLIPLEIRDPAFISTLGNINWFSGYLSVLAPVGICLFLFRKKNDYRKVIYGIYTVIAFMAGFCQGSDGIFLFFGALFFLLLWIAIKKEEWITDYFLLVFLWGFSAQAVRLIRFFIPENYNYDPDNLCVRVADSNITLALGIFALGIYCMLRRKQGSIQPGEKCQKWIRRGMAGLLSGGIFLWLLLAVFHTKAGIPGAEPESFLLLNENWGNGRGATFSCAVRIFREMPVLHKLLGAGPDCFSACAYSLPETAAKLRDIFGNSRLTNAHNELLTCLVNQGILGLGLWIGIYTSFVKRCMKKGEQNYIFYIFAASVICYFCHNMVSFAQVLNTSYLFLLLGMGERS